MAKPRVTHVPQATQAAAVRGNGGWWGLREAGRTLRAYENVTDNMFSPPVVPPDMRATLSSQAGSASPPVSIAATIPWAAHQAPDLKPVILGERPILSLSA